MRLVRRVPCRGCLPAGGGLRSAVHAAVDQGVPLRGGEVHHDVVLRGLRTVIEYLPQSLVDIRDEFSRVHGRERASTLVFHQCGV